MAVLSPGAADVVVLETGEATWALADAVPSQLEVYGGAVRIWWPGLTRASNPFDHRLYLVRSPHHAEAVFDEIVQAIRSKPEPTSEPRDPPVVVATVQALRRNHVELEADGRVGELRWVDGPLDAFARCLRVGTRFPARAVRPLDGNRMAFSARGLLPHPWELVGDSLARNDIVTVRVARIVDDGVDVEVLPRVEGFVYWTYVDWDIEQHEVSRTVEVGQIVRAKIAELDARQRRFTLSIRDAHEALGRPTKQLPSLVPGGLPFTWHDEERSEPDADPHERFDDEALQQIEELTHKLRAADADRRTLRDRIRALKKDLRSSTDKIADIEKRLGQELDPLSSERAFLMAVRVAYARMCDEGTRTQYPLQKMRVHGTFLHAVRDLGGVELSKILNVCAQVASGMAQDVEGREVHQLGAGSGGAKAVVRKSDGAIAWRCALQTHTSAARRLHWWAIPGSGDSIVESANAVLHDDVSIPE